LRISIQVQGVGRIIERYAHVVNLSADPFELPHQMMPTLRYLFTWDLRYLPFFRRIIPDIPFSGVFEAAFRAPGITHAPKALIQIKLQRFGRARVIDHEIESIGEVRLQFRLPQGSSTKVHWNTASVRRP
jgi:hypothetical protein